MLDTTPVPAQRASGALGVDGDHLPATAPDQEHPVQPLGQDLEELHIWVDGVKAIADPMGHLA